MDLYPDEMETELVSAARRMLIHECSREAVRRAHDSPDGLIPGLWAASAEQGWFQLAAPESVGGMGGKIYQTAMILEEVGRSLAPGPWVGTAIAGACLGDTAEGQRARAGAKVALALDFRGQDAKPRVSGGKLTGQCPRVHYAQGADALLVDVDGELWWVERPTLRTLEALDPGLRLSAAVLDDAQSHSVGLRTAEIIPLVDVLVAAQAAGVAEGAFRLALDYAMNREQFGKPIGSFQVVKHRLADAAARVEQARALTNLVAVRISEGNAPPKLGSAAWHLAVTNARANAHDAVLIHGAMGFTWECDAHLFLKRALSLGEFRTGLGDVLDEVAATVGEGVQAG
jgi:alkylation response protein AidB-like acyl-CoA dehydrogenase